MLVRCLLGLLFIFHSIALISGQCDTYYSLTELLNHDPKNHHIFTCKILATFKRDDSYESIALVSRVFRGSPSDTVYINTGCIGCLVPGSGLRLNPTSEWLIFSTTKDNMHYYALSCDRLSSRIKCWKNQEICTCELDEKGKGYLEIVKKYDQIRKSKYSGRKVFRWKKAILAEGNFKNGLPDGEWKHYWNPESFEDQRIKSKINYKLGKLDGSYTIYDPHNYSSKNHVVETRMYKNDLPQWFKWNDYKETYTYLNEHDRSITTERFDSSGTLSYKNTIWELGYTLPEFESTKFKHGVYHNKEDSSSYSPLATGQYQYGKKVGKWKYYDKTGKIIKDTFLQELEAVGDTLIIYEKSLNNYLKGIYKNGLKIGLWEYYYEGKLDKEVRYSSNGEKVYERYENSSGTMVYTPFLNFKIHGQIIKIRKNGMLESIETYQNGIKDGVSIFFDDNGDIKDEIKYKNGRAFSIHRKKNQYHYINGYRNGYMVSYNVKTGKKISEGRYWNGYETGVWISYYYDRDTYLSKTIQYYQEDKDTLAFGCNAGPAKTEYYNKGNKLIRVIKH